MVRLDEALPAVREALEAALQAAVPRPDAPHAVLANPAEASAKYGETSKGRILLTLAGLRVGAERRPPPREPIGGRGGEDAAHGAGAGAGALEADLLMTADYPGHYLRGLNMMTAALDWLHDNPVLTAGGAGGEGGEADRFTVELVAPAYEEAAALVGMAGVNGCPFALLRLRGLGTGGRGAV